MAWLAGAGAGTAATGATGATVGAAGGTAAAGTSTLGQGLGLAKAAGTSTAGGGLLRGLATGLADAKSGGAFTNSGMAGGNFSGEAFAEFLKQTAMSRAGLGQLNQRRDAKAKRNLEFNL